LFDTNAKKDSSGLDVLSLEVDAEKQEAERRLHTQQFIIT
jgi:hypothetical protein